MGEAVGPPQPDRASQQITPEQQYPFPFGHRIPYEEATQSFLREHSPLRELLLPDRVGDLFVTPGFDLQDTVANLGKPSLEVGGPTTDGYETLEGIHFPDGLAVSNLAHRSGNKLRAAANELPVADGALGVVMSSALDKVDVARLGQDNVGEIFMATHRAIMEIIASGGPDSVTADLPEARDNPRIGLIIEAKRALSPSGLLILKNFDPEDIILAAALGFQMKEHSRLDAGFAPKEVVLQQPPQHDARPNRLS